jgi:type III secretory pathway component EscS
MCCNNMFVVVCVALVQSLRATLEVTHKFHISLVITALLLFMFDSTSSETVRETLL